MIITKLISGLGNQLFQYTVGRQLSIKYKVPLKLDTTFYETQRLRNFKLDQLNINAKIATAEEIDKFLYWQKDPAILARAYRRVQKLFPRHMWRYLKESAWWQYDPDLLNASSHVYLDGYWQHHKYYVDIFPEIFNELSPKDSFPAFELLRQQIYDIDCSVSLHIRRGDYLTDAAASMMGVLPLGYYQKAFDFINSKIINPSYFIFSDDLDWARDHLNLDAPMHFVELDGSHNDCYELDLMSRCRHNIIANSSFSWWGAYLNRNPDKLVVAPAQWVISPEVNERIKLVFPSWTIF